MDEKSQTSTMCKNRYACQNPRKCQNHENARKADLPNHENRKYDENAKTTPSPNSQKSQDEQICQNYENRKNDPNAKMTHYRKSQIGCQLKIASQRLHPTPKKKTPKTRGVRSNPIVSISATPFQSSSLRPARVQFPSVNGQSLWAPSGICTSRENHLRRTIHDFASAFEAPALSPSQGPHRAPHQQRPTSEISSHRKMVVSRTKMSTLLGAPSRRLYVCIPSKRGISAVRFRRVILGERAVHH